ncbi:MAG: N-acetylmuramoyl-L-alanine amidase [Defluviitaleaceae bacterium]|nr:N-acetylmuramoyl-L-alanine amidase [Defluviitaleaceae bacterium]
MELDKQKYRGSRGYRNYTREAKELRKPAVILALLTSFMFALICFAQEEQSVPVFVFAETEDTSALAHMPQILSFEGIVERGDMPVIPICWKSGIFFDTYVSELFFPDNLIFNVESNYYHREHTITFEGLGLARRSFPLLPYDILPMRLLQENDGVHIRTRRGALVEYTESSVQIIDPRERYRTIVVIDAGHGGHDPGAPSVLRNAPYESEIVLNIVQKVLGIFDHPEILLIPTRRCDYFLSTSERVRIANTIGDYFISIHCNADSRSSRSNGTLTLYGTAEGSNGLAQLFQDSLITALQSPDRGVHYAPRFYILRESQIPVIILELLFQSNPADATRLSDPDTQQLIARTIADTIAELPYAR